MNKERFLQALSTILSERTGASVKVEMKGESHELP